MTITETVEHNIPDEDWAWILKKLSKGEYSYVTAYCAKHNIPVEPVFHQARKSMGEESPGPSFEPMPTQAKRTPAKRSGKKAPAKKTPPKRTRKSVQSKRG